MAQLLCNVVEPSVQHCCRCKLMHLMALGVTADGEQMWDLYRRELINEKVDIFVRPEPPPPPQTPKPSALECGWST